ncbi:MAG: YfhO family protein [Anaerolineales bacterium]|nr:YfhO family protein [Anaerolineales bacterium]
MLSRSSQLRTYLIDGLALLALCLLFFWRDLTPSPADHLSFAAGDFANQFVAFARYEASRLASWQLPLWNPYAFAGHPFLADPQAAVFYPISLLTMLVTAGRQGLLYHGLELEALLHYPLVALFTYLLARRLTGSRTGGLVAAVVFTFSGYLTSYPPLQLAILEVQTWLPLILLALELAACALAAGVTRRALAWTIVAGVVLGISTLAGHPQSSLLVLYGTAAFALFRLFAPKIAEDAEVSAWRRLGMVALFLAIGLAIAAVQLLPSLEFMRLSTRAATSFEEMGQGFTPYDLIQLVLPAVGAPFPALYVGILPLGLAAMALVRYLAMDRPDTRPVRTHLASLQVAFWGALGGLALLLSFGKHLPVYQLFYWLAPGWRLFRHQERTVVWTVLALALLAGFGAAWLSRLHAARSAGDPQIAGDTRLPRSVSSIYAGATVLALAAAFVFFVNFKAGDDAFWGFTAATLFLAGLLFLSALAIRSGRSVFILGVILLDLFTLNVASHRGPYVADPFPPLPVLQQVLDGAEPMRVANEAGLPENYGVAYQVEEIGGASPLRLASLQTAIDSLSSERLWEILNVGYVLSRDQALAIPSEQVDGMTDENGQPLYLHRLAETQPRAWLASEVVVEPDAERLWQRLADESFDLSQQVLLPAAPPEMDDPVDQTGSGNSISWRTRDPEHLALDVTSQMPAVLVLSELSYPGWRATVDGRAAPLLNADGMLRAVALEAGSHQVEMRFRPASVSIGLAISAITLLLVLVGLILTRRHR